MADTNFESSKSKQTQDTVLGQVGDLAASNLLHPAEHALEESANAGINLLNLALNPIGAPIEKFKLDEKSVSSPTQQAVSGLVSVIPYAIAGAATAKLMKFSPIWQGVTHSDAVGQVIGAAALDGLRDTRAGETRTGNIAGTAAGFSVFEYGNSRTRALSLAASFKGRLGWGMLGGAAQSVFSDLGSGRGVDFGRLPESATIGGGMNMLLPSVQYGLAKAFHLRSALPLNIKSEAPPLKAEPLAASPQGPATEATPGAIDSHVAADQPKLQAAVPEKAAQAPSVAAEIDPPGAQAERKVKPQEIELVPQAAQAKATDNQAATLPSQIDLQDFPSWSSFLNYASHLKSGYYESLSRGADSNTLRLMQQTDSAAQNMQFVAAGKFPPELQSYVDQGFVRADAMTQLQGRLQTDLQDAHWAGYATDNLEDMANYVPSSMRSSAMSKLTLQYQGSPMQFLLRSSGLSCPKLEDMYYKLHTLEGGFKQPAAGSFGAASTANSFHFAEPAYPGAKTPGEETEELKLAVRGLERILINPQTRKAAQSDLDSTRYGTSDLIDKYSLQERSLSRSTHDVELKRYGSFNDLYRLAAKLERLEGDQDGSATKAAGSPLWVRLALSNMEEIAAQSYPPEVRAQMDMNPQITNELNTQLDLDLQRNYRTGAEPFQLQDPAELLHQYDSLLKSYSFSGMYKYLQASGSMPRPLQRLAINTRTLDPVVDADKLAENLKAIRAIETGLMNPATEAAVRQDLTRQGIGPLRRDWVEDYAKRYDEMFGDRQVISPTGDYSSVVPYPQRQRA